MNQFGPINLSGAEKRFAWYTIIVGYNMEEKYVENVISAVSDTYLEELIAEYYIPIRHVMEINDGKKKIKKIKGSYAGYVFIKCKMNESLWNLLANTSGAVIIITRGGIPPTVSEEEIENVKKIQAPVNFELDDAVDFLIEQRQKYLKIVPEYSEELYNVPPVDRQDLIKWLSEAKEKQKDLIEEPKKAETCHSLFKKSKTAKYKIIDDKGRKHRG